MPKLPEVKLNNGHSMPVLGLGTFGANPIEVIKAVKAAIDEGYRHFDCALFYKNEAEVGKGIKEKIAEGVIKREDVFITSKLWPNAMRPDLVEPTLKKTLDNFGFDYLDLYLIHWPTALQEGEELLPRDKTGRVIYSDVDYVDTWKAMEEVCRKGLTKSIGVSNFNTKQLQRVLDSATIKPVTNQVEFHPYLVQKKLLEMCKKENIVITAYSPLGSNGRPHESDRSLLADPVIEEVAQKYKKTPAQIVIRYLMQLGTVPIPKSCNQGRIQENVQVFDFKLNEKDVAFLDTLNINIRYHPFHDGMAHKHYPFNEE